MDDDRLKDYGGGRYWFAIFFKIVQNKLHYAVHGHTAAEVIFYERADANEPFMGMRIVWEPQSKKVDPGKDADPVPPGTGADPGKRKRPAGIPKNARWILGFQPDRIRCHGP